MKINKINGFYIFILEKPLEFQCLKWFFTNFLCLNKLLQILNEFNLDLNKSIEFLKEIAKGNFLHWVVGTRLAKASQPRPVWAGGTSGSGYPVDQQWPGLAQNQLHGILYTPLNEELHEMASR
jgi:hypothetical protein